MKHKIKEQWSSRLGIIMAVMGSAVGLGNFLRFPGKAAKYEGGTFMIPYFIAFFLLGLPIAYVEWSIARYGGQKGYHSAPGIFRAIWPSKVSPYFGILGLIVPIGIYMYYVFIESWCLYYAWQYLNGALDLGKDPLAYKSFFASFTGMADNGSLILNGMSPALFFMLLCAFLNFFFIYRGLKGIEKVSLYGMPLLLVIALLVLLRVMTLGTPDPSYPERNVINGLGFMWNPDPQSKGILHSLSNSEMWLEAAGQIFFSLSVGFGVIINYASYLRKKDDILLSATTSAAGNEFAEVALGGLITIPAAFIFLGAAVGEGTFNLGFVTMPVVFAHMPLGQIFGFLWFFLLFIAAITSSLSMLQPGIAFFEEGLHLDRKRSVTILSLLSLVGTLFVVYFSKNLLALDAMDFWVGTFCIFLLAMMQVILAGWVFGAKEILQEASHGSLIKIPNWLWIIVKYVSPAYLFVIFIAWIVQNVPKQWQMIRSDTITQATMGFIMILIVFFMAITFLAVKKWHKAEKETI